MKAIIGILAGITLAAQLEAQTNFTPVRMAIVPESAEVLAVADVLTAEFSKNEQIQLLERAEIEKVYREQGLSAANKDYLKLGDLLGADGLLALQPVTAGTNRYISAQLVAVKPGVILDDRRIEWRASAASGWAENFQTHLAPLLPKLSVLPQDAIPISVVNFHAGVRSPAAAELERQIFFLTVERLVREKRLFVLERKRMQSLSEEKDLANQEAEPFWNGKYLLDGAIDRDGFDPNTVTINARLIPPGGSPILIEAKGSRTNCTDVVNQFAEKVLAALKIDARPAAWNTADEADRFFKEAQWNLAWKIFPQARQSAAAAWALGKHDDDAKILRVRTFMPPPDSGVIYFPPREKPAPEKIDDALHALRLYQMFSQDLPPDDPKPDSAWYQLGMDNLCIATRVLQQFNWSPEFYQPCAEKLADLRAEARSTAALLSRSPSVQEGYFVGNRTVKYDALYHFMEKESIYGLELDGGCLWQETPEETIALYRKLMSSPVFCYLHKRLWFRDNFHQSTLPKLPTRLVAWNEADRKRLPNVWNGFINELMNSTNVFVQMEARAVRLADIRYPDLNRSFETRAAYEDAHRAANQTFDKELTTAFTNFFDAFVENRLAFRTNDVDVLYLNWSVGELAERLGGDIVTPGKELLRNRYKTEYSAKLAAKDEELKVQISAIENLKAFDRQKAYLKASQPFDSRSFSQLFLYGFKDYSKAQALEIAALLTSYKTNVSGPLAQRADLQFGEVEKNINRILDPTGSSHNQPAFEQQKQFLKDDKPFDWKAFGQLFTSGFRDYSKTQAEEIKPLLSEYKKRHLEQNPIGLKMVERVEANVERILNPAAPALAKPTKTVSASEQLQAFEKQKAFLKASEPFDPQTFITLFLSGFKDYSKAQAEEIQPLLAEYKKNLSGNYARIGVMQVGQVEANVERIIHPAVGATTPPPTQSGNTPPAFNPAAQSGRPSWLPTSGGTPPAGRPIFSPNGQAEAVAEPDTLAPDPLVSSNIVTVKDFYLMPMEEIPGDKPRYFQFTDHRWIEGKLLLDFRYNAWVYSYDTKGNWQSSADKIFIGMAVFDPETRRWNVAVWPDPFTEPVNFTSHQSILWRGDLYSSHTGSIQKYDSQTKKWQPAGFAVEGGQFYNLDGRLYRTDYNSIQEITENGHATKLLASIQRQPPVSRLDSQGALRNLALFMDAQKNLCAAVHNKIFRWDGNDWQEIGAAATSFMPAVFEDGILFPTDGFNLRPARISRFEMQSNLVELCLSQPDRKPGQRGDEPRRAGANPAPKPLWKLPAELSLPNFSATLWQSDLYLMADHSEKQDIFAEQRGTRPDGTLDISQVIAGSKFASRDGYNASLFCFSRDLPAAQKVLMQFEAKDGCPPMAGIESRPGFGISRGVANRAWMQFTPQLLLCGQYAVPANYKPGIWVARLDSIASEVNALKQMQFKTRQQAKSQAEEIEKEAQAKDLQVRQAFLKKYDLNHNGIIDADEQDAAREDAYFIKYHTTVIRAQKEAAKK